MSAAERRKGVRYEQRVAKAFQAVGFDCYRVPNSGGLRVKGDLAGSVPAHIEAKDHAVLRMPSWLRQARDEAPPDVLPVVAFHVARQGDYAAVPLEAFAALLADAAMLTDQAKRTLRELERNGLASEPFPMR